MPIYEYKCTECAERFEVEQSIHDEPLSTLPGKKHEHRLKKVFSPVGIAFKGDGFYRNDARTKSKSTSENGGTDSPTKVSKDDVKAATSGKADTSSSTSDTKSTSASSSASSD